MSPKPWLSHALFKLPNNFTSLWGKRLRCRFLKDGIQSNQTLHTLAKLTGRCKAQIPSREKLRAFALQKDGLEGPKLQRWPSGLHNWWVQKWRWLPLWEVLLPDPIGTQPSFLIPEWCTIVLTRGDRKKCAMLRSDLGSLMSSRGIDSFLVDKLRLLFWSFKKLVQNFLSGSSVSYMTGTFWTDLVWSVP